MNRTNTDKTEQTGQLININPNESEELLLTRELMEEMEQTGTRQPTVECPVCTTQPPKDGKVQNDLTERSRTMSDNIPHTNKGVYQIMRDDEHWTKDALIDYIEDLEKITGEWWEETKKEYVKVVRCKDCIHALKDGKEEWCERMPWKALDPNWFCGDGEEQNDETD